MLLDAVMAATERAGHHLHRQRRAHQPPAAAGGARRRAARHRRPHGQRAGRARARADPRSATRCSPSTARNFDAGRLVARPAVELRPHRARAAPARSSGPAGPSRSFLTRAAAAARASAVIELDDLIRFVEHPVRAFLRERLGISVRDVRRRGRRRAAGRARRASSVGGRAAVARRSARRRRRRARACSRDRAGRAAAGSARRAGARSEVCGRRCEAIAGAAQVDQRPVESVEVNLVLSDGRRLSGTVAGLRGDTFGPSPTRG